MRSLNKFAWIAGFIFIPALVSAQNKSPKAVTEFKKQSVADIQSGYEMYKDVALKIWSYAEVGYKEYKSSALLQKTLRENGFKVDSGVAEIPTAFVASFGSGKPVIGILAEFDALPGLSQDSVGVKKERPGVDAGHGCGHHLFGTASIAAGIQLKKLMEANHLSGTIKVYGCPAEEGGSGKVYMVKAGLFDGVDAVIHWHPGASNAVNSGTSMANLSAKFRFKGLSAHAAASPEKGRSALDGVEAMDNMVNMMREHIPSDTRIHYVITRGGVAPNVVPDNAEVYYYVRNKDKDVVRSVFDRVVNAAKGAALGTGTTMEYEITGGVYNLLHNVALARVMQNNLETVGGVQYSPENIEFAKQIQSSFSYKAPEYKMAAVIDTAADSKDASSGGSTDVADVSWVVPTVGLSAATWVPGTPAHSWQATASGGTSIGIKGLMVAAKAMTLTGIDLLTDKGLLDRATVEFSAARGTGFVYKPLLGDRKPALNYRD